MNAPIKTPGPDHPITIEPLGERVTVRVGGRVIADSVAALGLSEAGYPAVPYIPLSDIDQTLLRPSETTTHCPYKGDASYYSIVTDDAEITDSVWTYPQPNPAVAAIASHAAFYPDKVEITQAPV